MSAILTAMAASLAPVIGSAVAALVGLSIHFALAKLGKKLDSQSLTELLDQMDILATQAVGSASQTVVDRLVKANSWGTPAAYNEALQAGIAAMTSLAAPQIPKLIAAGVTNLDAYFAHLLEAKIKQIKTDAEKPTASIVVPIPCVEPVK